MTDMPTWEGFNVPILKVLSDGATRTLRQLRLDVADAVGLSPEHRAAALPSGQGRADNRIGWAASYLNRVDALHRPSRGQYVITDLGRSSRTATDSSAALVRARRALTPGPDDVERAIASDLRAWRDRQARNASVSPTVILSDRGLDALARTKPRSRLDLEGVAGLGPIARTHHGDKLLAIVAVHLHDDRPSDDPGVAP